MSKESFNRKVMFGMYDKLRAIDYDNFEGYLSYDEEFILVLCLAYMALSKEKIIKKDMNNTHRLDRITRKVPTEDIDSLFEGTVVPNIIDAEESDHTWILDNIRDSIMHEKFDIDEKRRLILINNDWHDRKLKAEVPFEWFINYMEADILEKRYTDKCTFHRFFYNNYWNDEKRVNSNYVTNKSIYYRIDVFGSRIPISEVEEKVDKLMLKYSKEPLEETDIYKYETDRVFEPINYGREYFASYQKAKEKVKEELQKEYPDAEIRIFIDNRRDRINRKARKRLLPMYNNYSDFYQDLNGLVEKKGISLLKSIVDIYSFIKDNKNNEDLNRCLNLNDLILLINGKKVDNNQDPEANLNSYIETKQKLFSIYLHIYGLIAIVLNTENLKHPGYLELLNDSVNSSSRKVFEEFATNRKKAIKKILELNIKRQEMQNNYDRCPEKSKERVKKFLDILENDYKEACIEPSIINDQFKPVVYNHNNEVKYCAKVDVLKTQISRLERVFMNSNSIDTKKALKNVILKLYDELAELENTYLYGKTSPEETLEIMRNCFAHIGRINVSKYTPITDNKIVFLDFDNNNDLSGKIECNFLSLVRALDSTIDFTGEDEYRYIKRN